MRQATVLAACLALVPLAACSGGGSGGTQAVQGLAPPSQLSVVGPVQQMGSPGSTLPNANAGELPANSDYHRDPTRVYVYDPSIEPLDTVNMILCLMAQTAAAELVNEGAYLARIDAATCEQGAAEDTSSGQSSSGAGAQTFQIWAVDSTRASNGSAQEVHVWVPQDDEDEPGTIFVEVELSEGASADNPFGRFQLDFAGVQDGGTIESPDFTGTLATTEPDSEQIGFRFFESQGDLDAIPMVGDYAEVVAVNVQMESDQSQGFARIERTSRFDFGGGDSGPVTEEFLVAFDDTHFLRSVDGGAETAFSRTDFADQVWRYNLYDAETGARVDIESGFGFRTANGDYGWIGYFGMWAPPGVEVEDGETITRDEYGQAEPEQYTVFRAPGKLIHYSREELALEDVEGESFQWWNDGSQWLVEYSRGVWSQVAEFDQETGQYEPLAMPVAIDTAALGYLGMWSQTLGGQVAWIHGEAFVTYYEERFVDGDDDLFDGGATSQVPLYGFVDCLRAELTADDAETGNIFLPNAPDTASPHVFVFENEDMTLYHAPMGLEGPLDQVGLLDGEVPTFGPYTWGMQSGPLVTDPADLTNVWDVWNLDEFYRYETGPNPWNQYVAVRDMTNAFVEFDAPIRFLYTHETENDRNDDATYDGKKYVLEYNGPGNLHGLPYTGTDLDGDMEPDRYYPLFGLADGTLMGPTGVEYAVKATEVEQRLQVDGAYAGLLTLEGAMELELPDGSTYVLPDIGPRPEITDAPRVVAGEVVD